MTSSLSSTVASELQVFNINELESELESRGIDTQGNKAELVEKLLADNLRYAKEAEKTAEIQRMKDELAAMQAIFEGMSASNISPQVNASLTSSTIFPPLQPELVAILAQLEKTQQQFDECFQSPAATPEITARAVTVNFVQQQLTNLILDVLHKKPLDHPSQELETQQLGESLDANIGIECCPVVQLDNDFVPDTHEELKRTRLNDRVQPMEEGRITPTFVADDPSPDSTSHRAHVAIGSYRTNNPTTVDVIENEICRIVPKPLSFEADMDSSTIAVNQPTTVEECVVPPSIVDDEVEQKHDLTNEQSARFTKIESKPVDESSFAIDDQVLHTWQQSSHVRPSRTLHHLWAVGYRFVDDANLFVTTTTPNCRKTQPKLNYRSRKKLPTSRRPFHRPRKKQMLRSKL